MFNPFDPFETAIPPRPCSGCDRTVKSDIEIKEIKVGDKSSADDKFRNFFMDILEKTAPDQNHKNMILAIRRHDEIYDAVCKIVEDYALPGAKNESLQKREAAVKCLDEMLKLANDFLKKNN